MEKVNSVMILDDEPIVCERLRSTLEKVNLDIETFIDPNEAIKRFAEKKFQILITDLKMKELDGIEVLKLVQKVSPKTKVIIITGFATVEKAREALKIGAYDFIAKPFKLSQLRDLVIKALGLPD
ncbi:MAG: histidine kinase [Deltaproteobacteria bacterium RBG_13_43_22]|jgi:DNA-binding NtrC family response regulator|nr:MAG: histidine kinase [Deltaproteobacteria bacterium RBG_13_43_22]